MITRFCKDSDFHNDFDEATISMGEYEEGLADPPPPQPTATVWVTRDGQRIPVRDMSDVHLRNTIRMLQRLGITQMTAIPDTSEVFEIQHPTFRALLAEAEKRGLEL